MGVVVWVGGLRMEAVAQLRHRTGTLRIYRVLSTGRLYGEVQGFRDRWSRRDLDQLAGFLEELVSEVNVCDDPEGYRWAEPEPPQRENHVRTDG